MYYWCNTAGERKWSNWGNRRWNFKHGNNWFEFMFMRKEWIVHNHQFTTKATYRRNERKNTWHRVITSIERSVLQSLKTIYLHTSRTHQYSFLDISYKKLLWKEVAIVDDLKKIFFTQLFRCHWSESKDILNKFPSSFIMKREPWSRRCKN